MKFHHQRKQQWMLRWAHESFWFWKKLNFLHFLPCKEILSSMFYLKDYQLQWISFWLNQFIRKTGQKHWNRGSIWGNQKWCYLSRRILATSEFVSRRRAVFISIQRSYSSPIYILFLFNLSIRCFFVSFSDRIAQFTLRTWLQFLCLRHFLHQHYNRTCAQSLPNEFKSEVNSIWFALLSG